MRFLTFIFVLLIASLTSANGQRCVPPSKTTDDATRGGANHLVTMIEEQKLSRLSGRIVDPNGEPLPFGLAEIYTDPSWIRKGEWRPGADQQRIIACDTDEKGFFKIEGLKAGEYELRMSVTGPFDVAHILVTIDPRGGRKPLRLYMSIGD